MRNGRPCATPLNKGKAMRLASGGVRTVRRRGAMRPVRNCAGGMQLRYGMCVVEREDHSEQMGSTNNLFRHTPKRMTMRMHRRMPQRSGTYLPKRLKMLGRTCRERRPVNHVNTRCTQNVSTWSVGNMPKRADNCLQGSVAICMELLGASRISRRLQSSDAMSVASDERSHVRKLSVTRCVTAMSRRRQHRIAMRAVMCTVMRMAMYSRGYGSSNPAYGPGRESKGWGREVVDRGQRRGRGCPTRSPGRRIRR